MQRSMLLYIHGTREEKNVSSLTCGPSEGPQLMPSLQPPVFIVLPVYNRRETTRIFCDSLREQTYRDFVLILVDDGCRDGTPEMVHGYPFPTAICRGNGSLWWAGALRKGMARLAALGPRPDDLVMWVNDDVSFESRFLERAVQEIQHFGQGVLLSVPVGNCGAGCYVCDWPGFTFRGYGRHPERVDCASTRCVLAHYGDLSRCGAFRPRLLPHYLSDYEYTIRARRAGLRIVPAESICCIAPREPAARLGLEAASGAEILRRPTDSVRPSSASP